MGLGKLQCALLLTIRRHGKPMTMRAEAMVMMTFR
jgi:hypothetical protein